MKHFFFFLFVVSIFALGAGVQTALAQNATLYFVPASGQVAPGQNFTMSVFADTKGEVVNAVAAHFSYPDSLLEVVGVQSEAGLIEFHKAAGSGVVQVDVGKTSPFISGVQRLAVATFRARPTASGSALLAWSGDSAVLRNSDNQNILSLPASGNGSFQIGATSPSTPPPVPSTPPPSPSGPQPSPPSAPDDELVVFDIRAQEAAEDNIRLLWKTNRETRGQVHYGPAQEVAEQGDYRFSIIDGMFRTNHSFVLSSANAGEDYTLEIIATDQTGAQTITDPLSLADLFQENGKEVPPPAPSPTPESEENGGEQGGGRGIVLFLAAGLVVLLLLGSVVFWRMRAQG